MKPSNFQFVNPYLEELYFVENHNFDANQTEFEMQNSFNVQTKRSKDDNRAKVELTLEINMDNEKAPFKLRIKVSSDFKWENLDGKTLESLLKFNAQALLLGYMRPIVANITNSSKFPVYNLPFINFTE